MRCVTPESFDGQLNDHLAHRERHRLPELACRWIALACGFLLTLFGCGRSSTQSSGDKTTGELSKKVTAEVISIAPMSGEKVRILLKVTNVSKRDIVRAKALVTVQDADGNSLGSKSTYLIHGGKGGLAAGGSVEEDAIVDVSDKTKAARMTFEMEDIRFKE